MARAVFALVAASHAALPTLGEAVPPRPPHFFEQYCTKCHGATKAKGGINFERLLAQPSLGPQADTWDKVAEVLDTGEMPPSDASRIPSDAERNAAVSWVRGQLKAYEAQHAGEPGHVTVRRLTSGEYGYAIRDLTGIDIAVGIDASSDSVGGEGFTNFGDVQFVQDASLERYLEAAKQVAEHAVIGAGPLRFDSDTGRTGLELSALNRINDLHATKGFRVVSGEGGRPFGLERYGKAFFVAWYFKHRLALREPQATLRDLAKREGIAGRFAEHVWSVVNRPSLGYPTREVVERWLALPVPADDTAAALEAVRAGCGGITQYLTTWPSWFFGRGDLAVGGAGDESPLVFDDTSLKVEPKRHYTFPLGGRRRGGPVAAPGAPIRIFLRFANINPNAAAKPVVIWRNPRLITRGRSTDSTLSLRSQLPAEAAAALSFGASPDGTPMGEDDLAATSTVSFELPAPAAGLATELDVDAELGADRNAVVRVSITDREEIPARGAQFRAFLGDATSAGYQVFRAGISEYVALLPPNSHGEANPADKDPVPPPFDNRYNSPEHDAFVTKVKYQRADAFFTENVVEGVDREQLDQAWNDLFGSWPYHDAYLGLLTEHYGVKLKSARIQELTAAELATLPPALQPQVAALRAHYDEVVKALAAAQPGHVDDALAFASRAWRRPLTAAEATRLKAFYQHARLENSLEHDEAIRALLARILVAPAFLYRVETVANGAERPLDDWELASRLSFFLWSSIPDDALRQAAAAGELRDPTLLAKQVKRMTVDPRARRLATEFFGQWLGFYRFDQFRGVDTGRFPEFTDEIKSAMYDEAVSTFEYLVRHERPLKEILHADYTFLNRPLAKFYAIDCEVGSNEAVMLVRGANAFNRGGALRLGSVLTATSAPLRTSPVKRGDWVLRRILGTPTPPPPGDAGTLPGDPQTFGGMTLRQKLAEHKRNPTCANCHLRIDPLGFPLEGFDAVGRSRTTYPDGLAVDVTGEFADKTTIAGVDGLLHYLQGKETQVMKTLAKKTLGFALGRPVLASDRPLIEALTAAGADATFSDLAIKIVSSRQFRNHSDDAEERNPDSAQLQKAP